MKAALDLLSPNKRRSKLEIYIDVLRITGCGINKPTRIMFAANLSWRTFKEVIADLERCGLIERKTVGDRTRIIITEKGKRILRSLESVSAEFAVLNAAPPVRLR
ncbi:MAG: winged helix-turn-helix domain-containing protein [Candidatus Bathyarchaeia archaeon]